MTELRQLLVANHLDMIFLCETKARSYEFDKIKQICNMSGYFVVDVNGCKRGLEVMWNNDSEVEIQSFSLTM